MKIYIRNASGYKKISVEHGETIIDLGLHNEQEAKDLALDLYNNIFDLLGTEKMAALILGDQDMVDEIRGQLNDNNKVNMEITKEEYLNLRLARLSLDFLERAGVDNWDWYGEAFKPEGEKSFDQLEEELTKEILG